MCHGSDGNVLSRETPRSPAVERSLKPRSGCSGCSRSLVPGTRDSHSGVHYPQTLFSGAGQLGDCDELAAKVAAAGSQDPGFVANPLSAWRELEA